MYRNCAGWRSGQADGNENQQAVSGYSGKAGLYYSLYAFEQSEIIDDIILVVGSGQVEYVKNEISE